MIEKTTDLSLIKEIMCDKILFEASMPDEDLQLYALNEWNPTLNCMYLNYDNKAIIRLFDLSNITADMHVHLLPKYWGTGVSDELQSTVEDWIKENTQYCKIVIQTPQCCESVLKASSRNGYTLEGILTSGIYWRGNIENVILMSKFINRG
jgi:RimJ/RimL family protein N-acetyltransferase